LVEREEWLVEGFRLPPIPVRPRKTKYTILLEDGTIIETTEDDLELYEVKR